MLEEQDNIRLVNGISRMRKAGVSEDKIKVIVDDFKQKYSKQPQSPDQKVAETINKIPSQITVSPDAGVVKKTLGGIGNALIGGVRGVAEVPLNVGKLAEAGGEYLGSKALGLATGLTREEVLNRAKQGGYSRNPVLESQANFADPKGIAQNVGAFIPQALFGGGLSKGASALNKGVTSSKLALSTAEKLPSFVGGTGKLATSLGLQGVASGIGGATASGDLSNVGTDFALGAAIPAVAGASRFISNIIRPSQSVDRNLVDFANNVKATSKEDFERQMFDFINKDTNTKKGLLDAGIETENGLITKTTYDKLAEKEVNDFKTQVKKLVGGKTNANTVLSKFSGLDLESKKDVSNFFKTALSNTPEAINPDKSINGIAIASEIDAMKKEVFKDLDTTDMLAFVSKKLESANRVSKSEVLNSIEKQVSGIRNLLVEQKEQIKNKFIKELGGNNTLLNGLENLKQWADSGYEQDVPPEVQIRVSKFVRQFYSEMTKQLTEGSQERMIMEKISELNKKYSNLQSAEDLAKSLGAAAKDRKTGGVLSRLAAGSTAASVLAQTSMQGLAAPAYIGAQMVTSAIQNAKNELSTLKIAKGIRETPTYIDKVVEKLVKSIPETKKDIDAKKMLRSLSKVKENTKTGSKKMMDIISRKKM